MSKEKLEFHTEQRVINELIPYENNPRRMTEGQAKDLQESLEEYGLAAIPVIDTDNTICEGHQRMRVMQILGRGEETIDVRVPNRKMTQKEFDGYNVKSNKIDGLFDFDKLGNLFSIEELKELGFNDLELGLGIEEEDNYTRKIEIPVYEPKNEKPPVEELVSGEKVEELLAKIDKADIPKEIKQFLRLSAYRHYVFNYSKIADFYSHSEKELQELMEESALVIIDFDKAIENGYVDFTDDIKSIYEKDYD